MGASTRKSRTSRRPSFRALAIVIMAAASFGVGVRDEAFEGLQESKTSHMLVAASTVLVGWIVWATVIYLVSTWVFGG